MLDIDKIQLYLHLWYEDVSIDLLNKVSKYFKDRVYITLVKDSKSNAAIEEVAKEKFASPVFLHLENKENDQYSFYNNFKLNPTEKPWVLYIHDKMKSKKEWLDSIVDVFFEDNNADKINNLMQNEKVGIISKGGEYKRLALGQQQLIDTYHNIPFEFRQNLVKSVQTVIWTRELQFLLQEVSGLINHDNLNPYFTAGTVFLARNEVVKLSHQCVHNNFFEKFYRTDGDVGHAMERFYYYVSTCLEYENEFI